jgi:DNA-binding NtrC family response regulator
MELKTNAQHDFARVVVVEKQLERVEREPCDVLLITSVAFHAGHSDGIELLEVLSANNPRTQVLFVAEPEDIDVAMTALKAGSYHYAKQPIGDDELRMLVEVALEQRPPSLELSPAEGAGLQIGSRFLLGRSPAMQEVFEAIAQAAASTIPVLIMGETGTGKDLVAQAIHESSARHDGPYVPVHLGALPPDLVASELFGHERGAFTGALERRIGQFEQASDGTIFLDEISTVDSKVQISLLRLLEQKKFHRLGGRKTLRTNARIVVATNEDLRAMVDQKLFREDLYYRLDVFRITVAPLRERHADVPLLVDAFIRQYNHAFHKRVQHVAPETASVLESYAWPGNVRELKNVVQRAVLVCTGDRLLPEHLPSRLQHQDHATIQISYTIGTPLQEIERQVIARTLSVARSRKDAADFLGISRRALYNKIAKYGLD